jgi:flagellar biosynthesis/type III secretory pathway M-ring protein FliF/YscJ
VIRDLVSAATGLDTKRGDQLVVDAFPFESTLNAEPLALAAPATVNLPSGLPAWLQNLIAHKNFAIIAALGGAGIMALIVGWVVLVMRRRKKKIALEIAKSLEEAKAKELPGAKPSTEQTLESQMAEQAVEKAKQEAEALMKLKLPVIATKKTDVLTKHIAAEIKKDPAVMAQVVRSWLHGDTTQR